MEVVYGLIPMMLIIGFLGVVVFIWMAKTGQFDDFDGAANSIFLDDEYEADKTPVTKASSNTSPNAENDNKS